MLLSSMILAATVVLHLLIALCSETGRTGAGFWSWSAATLPSTVAYSVQSFSIAPERYAGQAATGRRAAMPGQAQASLLAPPPSPTALSPSAPRPPVNTTSCVWMHFASFGRSGNRLQQMEWVAKVLSHCSGVAISSPQANRDGGVVFPPLLVGIDGEADPSVILEIASKHCREVTFEWTQEDHLKHQCGPSPSYKVTVPRNTQDPSMEFALAPQVYPEKAVWKHDMPVDALAMYFRGGDVLEKDNCPAYHQAPCSLFMEAWRASNALSAYLIYDPRAAINPCVDFVREKIPASRLLTPPCDSIGCHMTLLARAPFVAVSGYTTFAQMAMELMFPRIRRVYFEYFCNDEPKVSRAGLRICVAGETTGLIPWHYDNSTRARMLEYPGRVVAPGRERNISLSDHIWAYLRGSIGSEGHKVTGV